MRNCAEESTALFFSRKKCYHVAASESPEIMGIHMDKKAIAAIAVLVVALFVGGLIFQNRSQDVASNSSGQGAVKPDTSMEIIFYYGAECPHCKDVEKFFEDNKISEKLSFGMKEVWHDQANAEEMTSKAASCGLQEKEIGVPFLFAEGKCYVGTPDVEAYFSDKLGLPAATK